MCALNALRYPPALCREPGESHIWVGVPSPVDMEQVVIFEVSTLDIHFVSRVSEACDTWLRQRTGYCLDLTHTLARGM